MTYGLNNRTSLNLILGATIGKQEGTAFTFGNDPNQFSLRPTTDRVNGFSIGVSADHYFILTNIIGIRLELGTIYQRFSLNRVQEQVELPGFLLQRTEIDSSEDNINIFLSPNIDLFLSPRFNLTMNLGNIAYNFTTLGTGFFNDMNTNEFVANFSPDDIGFGIEYNF